MATVKRDYYEVLGVSRNSDDEEIRRAFLALAREFHPDVAGSHGAEEQFRALAEAYTVLSNPDARKLYDRYGYRGRGNAAIDESLSENGTMSARGENIHLPIEIRSYEAEEGTQRVVAYHAVVQCSTCEGRGSVGAPDPECEDCGGTGQKRTTADLDVAELLQIEPCPLCGPEQCSRCAGTGRIVGRRRIRMLVPPGVEEGTDLRVSGEGHDGGIGSVPGDLLVRVQVRQVPKDLKLVRYAAFVLLLVAIATLVTYVAR